MGCCYLLYLVACLVGAFVQYFVIACRRAKTIFVLRILGKEKKGLHDSEVCAGTYQEDGWRKLAHTALERWLSDVDSVIGTFGNLTVGKLIAEQMKSGFGVNEANLSKVQESLERVSLLSFLPCVNSMTSAVHLLLDGIATNNGIIRNYVQKCTGTTESERDIPQLKRMVFLDVLRMRSRLSKICVPTSIRDASPCMCLNTCLSTCFMTAMRSFCLE